METASTAFAVPDTSASWRPINRIVISPPVLPALETSDVQRTGVRCVELGVCGATAALLLAGGARRRQRQRRKRSMVALRAAEKMSVIAGEDASSYQALIQWMTACGASISDAVITSDVEGYRGLAINRPVAEGEVLFEIPLDCCLAAPPGAEALLEPVAKDLERAGIEPSDAALAVAFAQERSLGSDSAWWLYVNIVGDASETFPCFFESAELKELQSPPLAQQLQATVDALKALADARSLKHEDLLSAWQLVHSRRFGSEMGRFMLPACDLSNHSFSPTCKVEVPEPNVARPSWKLVAERALSAQEPVTFRYCKDPNHLLLQNSGFIVDGNPHNRIMAKPADLRRCLAGVLSPAFPPEFAAWRADQIMEALQDPEGEGIGESVPVLGRNAEKGGLQWNPLWLNLCGLAVTPSKEAPHWSKREGGAEAYVSAIRNATFSLFETTLEDDVTAAKAGGKSANGAFALDFRIQQKELLVEGIKLAEDQLMKAAENG